MKKATVTHIIKGTKTLMGDQQAKIVGTKGYGGIIENGESWQQNAVREVGEETGKDKNRRLNPEQEGGITIYADKLKPVAVIDFYNGNEEEVPFGDPSIRVLFCTTTDFEGTAIATHEMHNPDWYEFVHRKLPEHKLPKGDEVFIYRVLNQIPTKGWVRRTKDWSRVIGYQIEICNPLELVL